MAEGDKGRRTRTRSREAELSRSRIALVIGAVVYIAVFVGLVVATIRA